MLLLTADGQTRLAPKAEIETCDLMSDVSTQLAFACMRDMWRSSITAGRSQQSGLDSKRRFYLYTVSS